MIFQRIWTSIAKKPYSFVIFRRGVGGGAQPLFTPLVLDMCTKVLSKIVMYFPDNSTM